MKNKIKAILFLIILEIFTMTFCYLSGCVANGTFEYIKFSNNTKTFEGMLTFVSGFLCSLFISLSIVNKDVEDSIIEG